ncbi:unnamed protein product, partial [Amoebophrya sp. A25]
NLCLTVLGSSEDDVSPKDLSVTLAKEFRSLQSEMETLRASSEEERERYAQKEAAWQVELDQMRDLLTTLNQTERELTQLLMSSVNEQEDSGGQPQHEQEDSGGRPLDESERVTLQNEEFASRSAEESKATLRKQESKASLKLKSSNRLLGDEDNGLRLLVQHQGAAQPGTASRSPGREETKRCHSPDRIESPVPAPRDERSQRLDD